MHSLVTEPARFRYTRRLWVAGVCAIAGPLIVPALIAIVLVASPFVSAIRAKRWGLVLAGFLIALIAGGGSWLGITWVREFVYVVQFGSHAASLAAAINVYYDREHKLPDALEGIARTGLYGQTAYEIPGAPSGSRPLYLPVHHWDGKSRVIVAVTGGPPYPNRRAYVILGDRNVYYATDAELADLLSEDDNLRESLGEDGRWASKSWRDVPGAP
jgi:hypothetical protein